MLVMILGEWLLNDLVHFFQKIECNKPLKKIKRYYRDGKFYCSKKCWLKALKNKEKPAEEK